MLRISALTIVLFSLLPHLGAQGPGWSIAKPANRIPEKPLIGHLFGNEFALGSATVSPAALTINGRGKMFKRSSVTIFAGTKKLLKGKEIVVTPDSDGMLPHVHMHFPKGEKMSRGTLMYTEQYSMRLTVLERQGKTMKLALHLSLPDYKKSFLMGTFEATIQN